MKKSYLLFVTLLLSCFAIQAQEENIELTQDKNEVKLNALYLVLGAFDLTYEHLLNEESGVGINIFLPFDEDVNESINYYISPYYRFYFGKTYAAGFFLEGFGMLNSVKNTTYYFNNGIDPSISEENTTDFALGIGLGGKWITKRGLLGEINLGIGRNLFKQGKPYVTEREFEMIAEMSAQF